MKLKENWIVDTNEELTCAPTIIQTPNIEDTKIISVTKQGNVYQLDRKGNISWTFEAKEKLSLRESMFIDEEAFNSIYAKPLIMQDKKNNVQRIVFGSQNSWIYCLDGQGKLLWRHKTGGAIKATPAFLKLDKQQEPYIVCGSNDKFIYLFDVQGKLKHKLFAREPIETTPSAINKYIVVGTKKGNVVAINLEGELNWTFSTNKKISAKAIPTKLRKDDKIALLVGSHDNTLYALSAQGEVLWTFHTNGAITSEAIVLPFNEAFEREIIFGSCDNTVYCVNHEGELLWSYETEFWVVSPPLAGKHKSGHVVIVGSYDHNVYVLDGAGSYNLEYIPGLNGVINQTTYQSSSLSKEAGNHKGKKISHFTTDSFVVGCALIPETRELVVCTKKGKIYNLKMG